MGGVRGDRDFDVFDDALGGERRAGVPRTKRNARGGRRTRHRGVANDRHGRACAVRGGRGGERDARAVDDWGGARGRLRMRDR